MNYVKGRNGRYLKEAGPHKKGHHIITHVLLFVIVMHLIARVRLQIFFFYLDCCSLLEHLHHAFPWVKKIRGRKKITE